MAILTRTPRDIATGQIVKVLDFHGDALGQPNCWYVLFQNEMINEDGKRYIQPDSWMLPIRPGDLQETDETERELAV
jgi:hypothetical protein